VGNGSAALDEAKKQAFNVVVVNYELPDVSGVELLNRFRETHPKTLRFIAATEDLKSKVMGHVLRGNQVLSLPFDRATIKISIERSQATDYGMNSGLRELLGSIRTFPTIPSLYLEVANALKDPNATTEKIGDIIAKDMAMTTKLVQVINSAYFGLPRTITDPTEAVGILGFETVKSLIITVKLLSHYDKVKPVYFSIDHIWRHSTNVARTARVMTLLETGDNERSGVAYTAGLMHDLGKVILAANFDGQYHGAHNVARKQQIPLWDVEKDIFGATHGEIGAYLLGLWGMSEEVVKVTALHHHPLQSGDKTFTPLTAVHVANALEYERKSESDGLPVPVIDTAYLEQVGSADRIELWRLARSDPDGATQEAKSQRGKFTAKTAAAKTAVKPADPAPAPQVKKPEPSEPSPAPSTIGGVWKWIGFALGTIAAVVVMARLAIQQLESKSEDPAAQKAAEAPPPVKHETAAIVPPAKPVETPKPAAVEATNTPAAAPAQPPLASASVPAPAAAQPAAPPKSALDKLELQAIFYSAGHPSALISGQYATVNQVVAKCRVLDISPSTVTVEYLDQRKTLTLR
jgi:HD-like signal output (HDOD) protein